MYPDMANKDDKSAARAQIDENLKRVYNELLSEEVPDRFKALLQQLKSKDKSAGEPE
jgi:hypothetical protein